MRGEKIFKILSVLEELVVGYLDLFEIICTTYPVTIPRVQKKMLERSGKRKIYFENLYWESKEKEKFRKLLYKLKQQGLIYEKKDKRLSLTEKGKNKLKLLKIKFGLTKTNNQLKNQNEPNNSDEDLLIIIYDIPEYERKKRNFLRNILTLNKFQFLQKSVWVKKGKVSDEFINFLKEIGVLDYSHLFKITRAGTIEKI